jgi:hypothetical protein
MRCPYCPTEIAFHGQEHGCPWPELSRGDPPTPEDFRGSDAESHLAAPALWKEIRAEKDADEAKRSSVGAGTQRAVEPTREREREHELKTWPQPFQALLDGSKTFELRRADRDFRVDDLLILCEWDPGAEAYTGRRCRFYVAYVTDGHPFGALVDGFVCLGLRALDRKIAIVETQTEQGLDGRSRPDDVRERGWTVAVHNDYRQGGVAHTFWLFTKGNSTVKGEGLTDAEALDAVRREIDRLES